MSVGTSLAAPSGTMAPTFEDEPTMERAPLPPAPTWLMPPPDQPRRSLRGRASSRLAALAARVASLPGAKVEIRYLDAVFALAASAAIGAISVLALLEFAT